MPYNKKNNDINTGQSHCTGLHLVWYSCQDPQDEMNLFHRLVGLIVARG